MLVYLLTGKVFHANYEQLRDTLAMFKTESANYLVPSLREVWPNCLVSVVKAVISNSGHSDS